MHTQPAHLPRKKALIPRREIPLHLMLLPGVILLFVFHYIPLGGLVIAFQRFVPAKGLFGNQQWVGLGNFRYVFALPNTINVLKNTIIIALIKMILGMLPPIIVALLLNELESIRFKRTVQTIVYFPHFLSWIVFGGIIIDILSPSNGLVNQFLGWFGIDPIYFVGDKRWFRFTVIFTDIWKGFGYGTVVYMASLAGIDPTQYEVASIDGANRWQQMVHITLPGLRMIIVLMMVLSLGNVLNAGFDQIVNLYSPAVYETGDVIDTMVYRMGLQNAQYGPSAAIGLFKSLVSLVFVSTSYIIAYKGFNYSLF